MVASLIARGVTVAQGPSLVLADVDLTVAPGQRIGLVGPNGVGKTTLLGALAGRVALEAGSVEQAPPDSVVGLLPQEPERSEDESVRAFLARRAGITDVEARLESATAALAAAEAGSDDAYSTAFDQWMALGAADFDARVGDVWADLGLAPELIDRPTSVLSGGEAARASLASLLLSRFDVFLLDEPTNDLDLDGLARLEQWVIGLRAGVVVVSHDRTFLERVVTDVVEIDFHTHRARRFGGGWSAFLAERELERQHAQERYDEFDTKRRTLLGRAQREREWASQGQAKVRTSGETDKHIRHFRMNQTEQLAGKAARTERAVERLEEVDEPRTPWELRLDIPLAGRSGDLVAFASGAIVDRGDFRLGPVDVQLTLGERVALVGANGAGKSTLIDLLLGRVRPDQGEAGLGSQVIVGEMEQARNHFVGHVDDARGVHGRVGPERARGPDVAGQVRARGRSRHTHRGHVVARGTHEGIARAPHGQRREPVGARRADEPSRPSGDRATRTGARLVRRHGAPRHPRPFAVGAHAHHPLDLARGRADRRRRDGVSRRDRRR